MQGCSHLFQASMCSILSSQIIHITEAGEIDATPRLLQGGIMRYFIKLRGQYSFSVKDNWCDKNQMKNVCLQKTLTLKHREMHGCVVSTVATDALVLKHQAISILSTD